MNHKYKNLVASSGKSLYKISNESGIPYSILNELNNEKRHINKLTAETVFKLCLYFDCTTRDILDPFPAIKNSKGIYLNIKYKWVEKGLGVELQINDNGNKCTLTEIKNTVLNPEYYYHYIHGITEMCIERYVNEKEAYEALP